MTVGCSAESNLSHIDFDAFQQLQKQETIPEVVPIYADGVQVSHVSGDVVRWRKDTESVERFDAQSYIRKCESEIASLRDQVNVNLLRNPPLVMYMSTATSIRHSFAFRVYILGRGLPQDGSQTDIYRLCLLQFLTPYASAESKFDATIPNPTSCVGCAENGPHCIVQVSKLMYQRSTGNELLDYIKVQEPAALKELTQHISTPVIEAMNSFVERLIGTEERRVEARNPELATTFYVLIVVGYYLRQLEVISARPVALYTSASSMREAQDPLIVIGFDTRHREAGFREFG